MELVDYALLYQQAQQHLCSSRNTSGRRGRRLSGQRCALTRRLPFLEHGDEALELIFLPPQLLFPPVDYSAHAVQQIAACGHKTCDEKHQDEM
jgi:hypothetical protein